MKGYTMWGIALMVVGTSGSVGVTFGPKNCVSLSRATGGSCVLSTDCEGVDISATEFAFDCVAQSGNGDIVRHSFGVGGFEASEEFDTEVKCGRCSHPSEAVAETHQKKKVKANLAPAPVLVVPPPAVKAAAVAVAKAKPKHEEAIPGVVAFRAKGQAAAQAKAKMWPFTKAKSPLPAVGGSDPTPVMYGPKGCVSTWRSSEGHCMMRTNCKGTNISNYEFGLVCVDKAGSPVKHLFGKDSFDSEESFDTLIKCKECLGLEDVPDQVVLAGEVATMAKDLSNLKDVMKNISINVQMLNSKVFPPAAAAPAPAAAAPAPAAAAKPQALLLHHADRHHRHRGNLRRSHRHHRHHRRHDDDDDDDDDEDRDDDHREEDRRDDDENSGLVNALASVAVPVQAVIVPPTAAPKAPMNEVAKASDDDDEGSEEGSDED